MTGKSMVFVTCPDKESAESISESLVDKRLVACVNIIPNITSVYKWKDKVEKDTEFLLIIKTKSSLVGEVSDAVKSMHSYDVPEVISTGINDGLPSYIKWIDEVTK